MNLSEVDDVPLIIDVSAWSEAEVGAEVVSLTEETLELRGAIDVLPKEPAKRQFKTTKGAKH